MIKKIALFKILPFQILFSWILIGSVLSAQKVTQIKFEGLAHLSPTTAKEIAGIRVGEEINAGKINDSIKNFFSQGYFKDVWVDQQGGVLIYHFEEKLAIANVEIKGFGSGDEGKQLLEGIGLKKGDLYDNRRVSKAKRTLISRLESQGYYDTVVDVTTTPVGESSVSLVFDVNKGEKIIIREQNFVGAEHLVQSDLELDLANKERDFLSWMPWRNSGEATVDQLEYDAYRVKDAYMRKGYLDAYVSKPLMRVDFGSYNAKVDYQVVEGVQYRVGTIGITQDVEGLNTEELKDNLILKEGKIFNIKRMRKDISNLEEQIGNLGYAFAKVAPQMHKETEQKIINLNYVVQPGEIVTVNDVIISGNDSTKDRVIRRYIYLAPGDTFNATDLKDSKNALGRTGFFENVDIQSQRVAVDKVNLLVKVKETSTGTISAGGGYGSYEGLMVNASISDRNFFGTGINTTLGFEVSKISTNYNLSFVNPKVWDSMYSFGLSLYKKDYEYIDFTQDQLGGSMTLGRQFYRHINASVGIGYVDNDSKYNDDYVYNPDAYNAYYDQYKKTSIFTSVSFDNTDDFYTPREGWKAALNLEYATLDGDDYNATLYPDGYSDLFKVTGRVGYYYGLEDWIDYDLILRLKGRVTSITSTDGDYIPIGERLFMGGIGSVRGYDPYSISPTVPRDFNGVIYDYRIGGTDRASGSVEASIPLSQAAKMRLTFFYDYGWITSDSVNTVQGVEDFDSITRSSAGVVVEWQSGFGPINLVFGYPIDDEEGDETSVFEFSMGTKF